MLRWRDAGWTRFQFSSHDTTDYDIQIFGLYSDSFISHHRVWARDLMGYYPPHGDKSNERMLSSQQPVRTSPAFRELTAAREGTEKPHSPNNRTVSERRFF